MTLLHVPFVPLAFEPYRRFSLVRIDLNQHYNYYITEIIY